MVPAVQGQTILVTGAAGFVGNHLVEALATDNDVLALDHFESNARDQITDAAQPITLDLCETDRLRDRIDDVDLIFHQAGAGGATQSIATPQATHESNVDATLGLLEFARDVDARVVLASSAAVYGDASTLPIEETAPKHPRSPYGIQKLALDQYARQYHDLYGLETVVLRYFNVYGERVGTGTMEGVIGTFLEQATADGRLTVAGDGTQTRDFVHVSDIVQANLRAATTAQTGRAYNIGSGTRLSIHALAELVADCMADDIEIVHTEAQPGGITHSHAALSRARSALGYEPTVALEDCLRTWLRLTEDSGTAATQPAQS